MLVPTNITASKIINYESTIETNNEVHHLPGKYIFIQLFNKPYIPPNCLNFV